MKIDYHNFDIRPHLSARFEGPLDKFKTRSDLLYEECSTKISDKITGIIKEWNITPPSGAKWKCEARGEEVTSSILELFVGAKSEVQEKVKEEIILLGEEIHKSCREGIRRFEKMDKERIYEENVQDIRWLEENLRCPIAKKNVLQIVEEIPVHYEGMQRGLCLEWVFLTHFFDFKEGFWLIRIRAGCPSDEVKEILKKAKLDFIPDLEEWYSADPKDGSINYLFHIIMDIRRPVIIKFEELMKELQEGIRDASLEGIRYFNNLKE